MSIYKAGFDESEDMYKVKSIQKKWRDSFTNPLAANWHVTESNGSTATISGGVLTLSSGTTAGGFCEILSKETFTIPFRAMIGVQNTRNANNHHIIEAVSVDPNTGVPDGKHSMAVDIGGAASATATQMLYYVQNGGLIPLASAASTIVTTASYSVIELEPFSDECYFHSRTIDATSGRTNSYVRHQQIPDPNAVYKLRLRSQNHGAYKSVTGAVAGTGNVIRLTVTAHGYTTGNTVWVDSLNGVTNGVAEVRGNYVVTVIDANTIDLDGTTFGGTYVAGSGRVAVAGAPTAVSMQFQFINCQDYAELTAEITAGRGQIAVGQSMGVTVVGAAAASTAIGQAQAVGVAAHDAVISGAPVRIGGRAITADYTSVATGDTADLVTTLKGALIVRPNCIPENDVSGAITITNSTADTSLIAAGGAGLKNYIMNLSISNSSATATVVTIKDGTTARFNVHVPAGGTITLDGTHPLFTTTANTAVNAACGTAVTSVYVNASGYRAP